MIPLRLASSSQDRLVVVAIGAHCDDIEIGAGGLLLELGKRPGDLVIVGLIMTSSARRATEARGALEAFAPGATIDLEILDLPDGRLPGAWDTTKEAIEATKARAEGRGGADIVLCPSRYDLHQDHRMVAKLVPTAFRSQLILGYEILKWDGDLGRPNAYVPLDEQTARRKSDLLHRHYESQASRSWFDEETFLSLMRVRGVECGARYAEGFTVTKAVLDPVTCGPVA